jgi:hypothetical protein
MSHSSPHDSRGAKSKKPKTEHQTQEGPGVDHAAIEEIAAALQALINSRAQSPSKSEIASVIARVATPERCGRIGTPVAGAPFRAVLDPSGKPLQFKDTNLAFCDQFLPWVRMTFALMGLDQPRLEKYLRDLAKKGHGEDVAALLDGLIALRDKFTAIGGFADGVLARITIAGDAIVAREEALAGRAAQ